MKRVNVSLDTLDPEKFRRITRWGDLGKVMEGIDAAQAAGLAVKINAVALKDLNEDEIPRLLEWAHGRGMDLTLIEVMPLGEIETQRVDQYLPLSLVRARLMRALHPRGPAERTGGPARYVRVKETGGKLGFITPLTHNFCESCNRVRLTCTGQLYMCLGQEDAADLRTPLRALGGERGRRAGDRGGDLAQAQGPRLRHRPRRNRPAVAPPHERDRRLTGHAPHGMQVGELLLDRFRPLADDVAGMLRAGRLDEDHPAFLGRRRHVLDAARNHVEVAFVQHDVRAVAIADDENALADEEELVLLGVAVPDELALDLRDLHELAVCGRRRRAATSTRRAARILDRCSSAVLLR